MKKSHPAFWAAGWAGMTAGAVLTVIGVIGSGALANLAGGYGLMVVGSSLYLLAGLKLRERLGQRTRSVASTSSAGTAPVSNAPSTASAAGRS